MTLTSGIPILPLLTDRQCSEVPEIYRRLLRSAYPVGPAEVYENGLTVVLRKNGRKQVRQRKSTLCVMSRASTMMISGAGVINRSHLSMTSWRIENSNVRR